jgi:oxaloacetate decarboxylase gamma subunit
MQGDLINQGLELMLFGMGTVVMFLALLVLATALMSRVVERFFPEPEPEPLPVRLSGKPSAPERDAQLLAVISAAIHRHRNRDH